MIDAISIWSIVLVPRCPAKQDIANNSVSKRRSGCPNRILAGGSNQMMEDVRMQELLAHGDRWSLLTLRICHMETWFSFVQDLLMRSARTFALSVAMHSPPPLKYRFADPRDRGELRRQVRTKYHVVPGQEGRMAQPGLSGEYSAGSLQRSSRE